MRIRLALVFTLLASFASAQNGATVKQSGNVTPNTVPWWITSGVVGGGVTSADSPISSFGVTNNGYNGICTNSQRITAAGRQTLCMGVTDTGGGRITLQNYGTDTAQPFQFVINGTAITPAGGITALTVGSTTIGGGTQDCLAYDVSGILQCLSTANNSVLATNGSGVPAYTTALPNGVTATTQAVNDNTNKVATDAFVQQQLAAGFSCSNLPSGVNCNSLNTQTTTYSVATSDCGKTIQLGTGSTGQFTLTVPSVSGFAATCSVLVANGDTGRGKNISGVTMPDGTGILWPQKSFGLQIINGAWTITAAPSRYQITGQLPMYVDSTGSDTNDCLAPTTGACAHLSQAVNLVTKSIDVSGWPGQCAVDIIVAGSQTIDSAHAVAVAGPFVGASIPNVAVCIDGNNNAATLNVTTANAAVESDFSGDIAVKNINITAASGTFSCLTVHFGGKMTLLGTISCTGTSAQQAFFVSDSSFLYASGITLNLGGSFTNTVFENISHSNTIVETTTVNLTSNLSAPVFTDVQNTSVQFWGGSTTINLGAFTFTGQRFQILSGGNIALNTSNNLSFFPGSGFTLTNGTYDQLPVQVAGGGTGATSLTAHGILLGEGTTAITPTAVMTNGQLLVGQSSADPLPKTISGDCTLASSGAITCLDTNGAAFTSTATAAAGQIPATATNDNASAGKVGEFISANCVGPTNTATVTITIAAPGVITWTGHPFKNTTIEIDACPVVFTNSGGALPTGITAGTVYWVVPSSITTNTFTIATSVANALAGTAITTSGSQSGTQTATAGTSLSSGTDNNISGISLTAGDWDVFCEPFFTGGVSTTVNAYLSGLTTSGSFVFLAGQYAQVTPGGVPVFSQGASIVNLNIGPWRQSLSGTTTVFCRAQGTFGVSTMQAYGLLRARRAR